MGKIGEYQTQGGNILGTFVSIKIMIILPPPGNPKKFDAMPQSVMILRYCALMDVMGECYA